MKRIALAFGAFAMGASMLAPSSEAATVYAVNQGANQQIVSFDTSSPTVFQSQAFIQGLQPNENLVGIDRRPSDQMLYGIGSSGRLYQVNFQTGVARLIAPLTTATGQQVVLGGFYGVDFNPQADAIRVVSNNGQNLAVNPNTGVTTVQPNVTYQGDATQPSITAVAYANNVAGATSTTLWAIDTLLNEVVRAVPPLGNGIYERLNRPLTNANPTELTGFDIETGTGIAYGAFRPVPGSTTSSLYTIDLNTGTASLIGMIGRQEEMFVIGGITLGPAIAPEPGTLMLVSLGGLALAGRRRRK